MVAATITQTLDIYQRAVRRHVVVARPHSPMRRVQPLAPRCQFREPTGMPTWSGNALTSVAGSRPVRTVTRLSSGRTLTQALTRRCQRPSVSPGLRPSVLPNCGHRFSPRGSPHWWSCFLPLVATNLPTVSAVSPGQVSGLTPCRRLLARGGGCRRRRASGNYPRCLIGAAGVPAKNPAEEWRFNPGYGGQIANLGLAATAPKLHAGSPALGGARAAPRISAAARVGEGTHFGRPRPRFPACSGAGSGV